MDVTTLSFHTKDTKTQPPCRDGKKTKLHMSAKVKLGQDCGRGKKSLCTIFAQSISPFLGLLEVKTASSILLPRTMDLASPSLLGQATLASQLAQEFAYFTF